MLRRRPCPAGAKLLGKGLDQQRMIVPFLDKIDGKRRVVAEQHLLVESDAGAGIVRRQADCDALLDVRQSSSAAGYRR